MSRIILFFVAVVVLLSGCMAGSAASFVLRSPVEDKCAELKLKSCDHLAEGVVLYVEGKKAQGYRELRASFAANTDEPLRLKALATGLKLLEKAPGVGPYVATLRPVVEMMDDAANEALLKRREQREEAATASRQDDPAPASPERPAPAPRPGPAAAGAALRAGTVLVPNAPRAAACKALSQTGLAAHENTLCAPAFRGALLVTDLHSTGGCPNELVILAGDPMAPAWFILVRPDSALNVHGAALPVGDDDVLTIVARPASASGAAPVAAPGCAVTWAGRKL